MSQESQYLLAIAQQVAETYTAHPQAKAAMVTGSVAEENCDRYSDIDMSIYYDQLLSEEELEIARLQNQGSERIWVLGDRNQGGFAEAYFVNGVECQVGHVTIATWERDMATVLEQLDVTSWVQKALSGLLIKYQMLVETAQNILGVLAGLNRLYYSTFQFKRMGKFIEQMNIAPKNLSARLDNLFDTESPTTAIQLIEIVQEIVNLVELHMPQIDTSQIRQKLDRRKQAW